MSGKIKAGKGTLIGNAGKYYVIAAFAPGNTPSFDILATKNGGTALIRVKTKSAEQRDTFRSVHARYIL